MWILHNQPPVLVTLPDTVFIMPGEIGDRVQKKHVVQLVYNIVIERSSIFISVIKSFDKINKYLEIMFLHKWLCVNFFFYSSYPCQTVGFVLKGHGFLYKCVHYIVLCLEPYQDVAAVNVLM